MWSTTRNIAPGDLVIIWLTRDSVQPLIVTPGKEFNGKFGVYSHSDLVGIPYGSKVGSRNGRGFIHVLRPTPELWTMALPHRTQILYIADIAFIVSYLDIKPGSQVVEAGTGSGSFSHSVARTVGPNGHLYSYEFHEARANKAREEFRIHGLSEIITLTHRNVCKEGFTVVDQADSVFLDLPAPWDAVMHAKKALRKDRATRICCFSPCMEQVLRTIAALNDAGFSDITMYETLLRPYEVHTIPTLQPIGEVSRKLKQQEARREYKRRQQIAASQAKKEQAQSEKKRKRSVRESEELELKNKTDEIEDGETHESVDVADTGTEAKKIRVGEDGLGGQAQGRSNSNSKNPISLGPSAANAGDGDEDPSISEITEDLQVPSSSLPSTSAEKQLGMAEDAVRADSFAESGAVVVHEPPPDSTEPLPSSDSSRMVVSRVINEVRGHTSYLTFAVLLPTALPGENSHMCLDATENRDENASKDMT